MILDDPYDDPSGLEVPDRSPEPTKEQLDVSNQITTGMLHLKWNKVFRFKNFT